MLEVSDEGLSKGLSVCTGDAAGETQGCSQADGGEVGPRSGAHAGGGRSCAWPCIGWRGCRQMSGSESRAPLASRGLDDGRPTHGLDRDQRVIGSGVRPVLCPGAGTGLGSSEAEAPAGENWSTVLPSSLGCAFAGCTLTHPRCPHQAAWGLPGSAAEGACPLPPRTCPERR